MCLDHYYSVTVDPLPTPHFPHHAGLLHLVLHNTPVPAVLTSPSCTPVFILPPLCPQCPPPSTEFPCLLPPLSPLPLLVALFTSLPPPLSSPALPLPFHSPPALPFHPFTFSLLFIPITCLAAAPSTPLHIFSPSTKSNSHPLNTYITCLPPHTVHLSMSLYSRFSLPCVHSPTHLKASLHSPTAPLPIMHPPPPTTAIHSPPQ